MLGYMRATGSLSKALKASGESWRSFCGLCHHPGFRADQRAIREAWRSTGRRGGMARPKDARGLVIDSQTLEPAADTPTQTGSGTDAQGTAKATHEDQKPAGGAAECLPGDPILV